MKTIDKCMKKVGEFNIEQARIARLKHLWDIILVWSGYEIGWYSEKEIARHFKLSKSGLYQKLQKFKLLEPEAYEKISKDRKRIRKLDQTIKHKLENPIPYYGEKHDIYIKEKF